MNGRTGERIGWLAGWAGSFLWAPVLGIVFLIRGRPVVGAVGLALAVAGMGVAYHVRPWRHPDTPFWKLMPAPMAVLAIAVAWTLWGFGPQAVHADGPGAWVLLPILGVFVSPFFTVGRRRWRDGEPRASGGSPGENATDPPGQPPRSA